MALGILNREMGGPRYKHKWGHCYFSYLAGVEDHRLGGAHIHVAGDLWIDGAYLKSWWAATCGFPWFRPVTGQESLTAYILKHVIGQDDQPHWWIQKTPRAVILEGGLRRVVLQPGNEASQGWVTQGPLTGE
jgi:hypothetical protein